MPKVYAVYLKCTDESGLNILTPWVGRVLPALSAEYLVVDNANVGKAELLIRKNVNVIPGDNSCWEFSGFDKGVTWFEFTYELKNDDVFVFANDTFHRSYGKDYLNWFLPAEVRCGLAEHKIIGYVDAYPEEVEFFGYKSRSWVRTSLFVLTYGSLKKLKPFVIPYSNDQIFSNNYKEFFRPDAPLSNNYKQFLKTWLFGDVTKDSIFKDVWHSKNELAAENFEFIKAKVRTIFCEFYFSARAKELGIEILDIRCNEPRRI